MGAAAQGLARGAMLCLVLLVSACSIYSLPESEPAPVEKQPDHTVVTPPATDAKPSPRPAQPSSSAAYEPLLARAEQASAKGDYEQALALLERAQRIDPDNAKIYLDMARTHRARGDSAQASATAERGLLYCSTREQCAALRAYTR